LLGSYNVVPKAELKHDSFRLASKRGFGGRTPDSTFIWANLAKALLKGSVLHDTNPGLDIRVTHTGEPFTGVFFRYDAYPLTNLTIKAQAAYWSDRSFRTISSKVNTARTSKPIAFSRSPSLAELERRCPRPTRDSRFFETVERLPDVRLTGFASKSPGQPLFTKARAPAVGFVAAVCLT